MNTNSAEPTVKPKEMQSELSQNAELRLMGRCFCMEAFRNDKQFVIVKMRYFGETAGRSGGKQHMGIGI